MKQRIYRLGVSPDEVRNKFGDLIYNCSTGHDITSKVGLEIMAKFEYDQEQLQNDPTKGQKFTDLVRCRTVAFMLRRLFRDLKRSCMSDRY